MADENIYDPRVSIALSPRAWGGAPQQPVGGYDAYTDRGDTRLARPIMQQEVRSPRRSPWDISAGGYGGYRGGVSSSKHLPSPLESGSVAHGAQLRATTAPRGASSIGMANSVDHAIRPGGDGNLEQVVAGTVLTGMDIAFGGPPQMVP